MATYYWVGGTGIWDDTDTTHWSLISGGAGGFGPPTSVDDIIFNQAATYTVTTNFNSVMPQCRNITVSAGTVSFNGTADIYGSLDFTSATTWTFSAVGGITFRNTSNITISAPSISFDVTISFSGGTGVSAQLSTNLTSLKTVTLGSGALILNGFLLTCSNFNSSGSSTRSINFGSGGITVNGTGTLIDTLTSTNLTLSSNRTITVSNNTGTVSTITTGSTTEANSFDINVINGTYGLGIIGNVRTLNLTGFGGTLSSSTRTIYGDLTLSSVAGFSVAASSSVTTFASTTSRTITTNGKTIDTPLTFNGVGGTWTLLDNLTMGSTRTLTHTNGTINLNEKTLTVGTSYTTATGTKNLTFNAGTLSCSGGFSNAQPTNFTTSVGLTNTSPGFIRMTSASSKTFASGTSGATTYNCTLVQAGTGTLTITGTGNTFSNITNSVQPAPISFTSGSTYTFNNFNVNGVSGSLILLTTTSAANANIVKVGGIVSCNYLQIEKSTATPSSRWYAGTTSIDVGTNSGWIFTAPPSVANTGAFFSVF